MKTSCKYCSNFDCKKKKERFPKCIKEELEAYEKMSIRSLKSYFKDFKGYSTLSKEEMIDKCKKMHKTNKINSLFLEPKYKLSDIKNKPVVTKEGEFSTYDFPKDKIMAFDCFKELKTNNPVYFDYISQQNIFLTFLISNNLIKTAIFLTTNNSPQWSRLYLPIYEQEKIKDLIDCLNKGVK